MKREIRTKVIERFVQEQQLRPCLPECWLDNLTEAFGWHLFGITFLSYGTDLRFADNPGWMAIDTPQGRVIIRARC